MRAHVCGSEGASWRTKQRRWHELSARTGCQGALQRGPHADPGASPRRCQTRWRPLPATAIRCNDARASSRASAGPRSYARSNFRGARNHRTRHRVFRIGSHDFAQEVAGFGFPRIVEIAEHRINNALAIVRGLLIGAGPGKKFSGFNPHHSLKLRKPCRFNPSKSKMANLALSPATTSQSKVDLPESEAEPSKYRSPEDCN